MASATSHPAQRRYIHSPRARKQHFRAADKRGQKLGRVQGQRAADGRACGADGRAAREDCGGRVAKGEGEACGAGEDVGERVRCLP